MQLPLGLMDTSSCNRCMSLARYGDRVTSTPRGGVKASLHGLTQLHTTLKILNIAITNSLRLYRYSEFDQLRTDLVRAFPHAEAMIPELPRKSVVSRFRPKFLEARKAGLSHFLKYVQMILLVCFDVCVDLI